MSVNLHDASSARGGTVPAFRLGPNGFLGGLTGQQLHKFDEARIGIGISAKPLFVGVSPDSRSPLGGKDIVIDWNRLGASP